MKKRIISITIMIIGVLVLAFLVVTFKNGGISKT